MSALSTQYDLTKKLVRLANVTDLRKHLEVVDKQILSLEKMLLTIPNTSGDLFVKWMERIGNIKKDREKLSQGKTANVRPTKRNRSPSPTKRKHRRVEWPNENGKCCYCHKDHLVKECPVLADMICFGCSAKGHQIKRCPKKGNMAILCSAYIYF